MPRRIKPPKPKVGSKRSPARRSPKTDTHRVRNLETQLAEAREQQTATAAVLRVISQSRSDVQPVFDAIVSNAVALCDGLFSTAFQFDGELLHLAATHNLPPAAHAALHRLYPTRPTRALVAARAILERTLVHIPDIELEMESEQRAVARAIGWRSGLIVPIMRGGDPIGVITVGRAQPGRYSDSEIALLQTFADQAVIAIDNARLFTQLEQKHSALTQAHARVTEALEQQTATSDILRVISSSPTDVQPVFDVIVRSAAVLCGGSFAAAFRYDGHQLHLAAHHNIPALGNAFPMPVDRQHVTGRAVLERRLTHVPDVLNAPGFARSRQLALTAGFRSTLAVPMLHDGEPIGAITVGRAEAAPFNESQLALLQTFADQAVIAIENVRLFEELQARNSDLGKALEQQTATAEILRVIASSPTDTAPVFQAIIDRATRLSGSHLGLLWRYEGGGVFRAAASSGAPPAFAVDAETPRRFERPFFREGGPWRAAQIPDVRETEPYRRGDAFWRRTADEEGMRTLLVVPLVQETHLIGSISIYRREVQPFTAAQVDLVRTFADQAVIAIENVRLFKELQARNAELTTALERQTATSEILRVISGAQQDAQEVFDTIVQSAVRLCHATTAAVFRVEDDILYHPANYGGDPAALAGARAWYPRPVDMHSVPGMVVLERSVIQIPDCEEAGVPDLFRQVGRTVGVRSTVGVPMLHEGEVVGALLVARREAGRFSEPEVELLRTFSDQAVIAIENVRLFRELQARTADLTRSVERLTALGEVGRAVSSTLDLETVLTTIVTRAVQLSGLDGGVVFEYDADGEEFVHRAATETGGTLAAARRAAQVNKGEGVVGRTAITLEPAQVPDITRPGAYESRLRENLITSGVRAILAVPMLSEDRVIGCLVVSRNQPGEFPAETIDLLRTFATQSALAIQNARLFEEIADKSRQLEAASRHKSEFLANMSHELRTPLNAVIGFSEVLLQRMFGDLTEKQDEYLKDIYSSGQHLLSLINDILDLSKIEAGRMELAPAPFHLPSALDNAVTLVKERAARHGITLQIEVDPGLGEIVGDERKLKQVLLNLLSNAVKFTPERGRVTLTAARRDGTVEIAVTDTGIGIAPEDQAAIFEEFRQVGHDETRKQEGTGLGLTLAKKFVELHGGRIWVKSAPGRGSTFTFTLPGR